MGRTGRSHGIGSISKVWKLCWHSALVFAMCWEFPKLQHHLLDPTAPWHNKLKNSR